MNMTPAMVMLLMPSSQKMVLMLPRNMNSGMVIAILVELYIMTTENEGVTERPRRLAQRPPRRPPRDLRGNRAADFAKRRLPRHQSGDGVHLTLSSRAMMKNTCRTSGEMTATDIRMPMPRLEKTTPESLTPKKVSQAVTRPTPSNMSVMMGMIRLAGAATTMVTIMTAEAAMNTMGKIIIAQLRVEFYIGMATSRNGSPPILPAKLTMVMNRTADDAMTVKCETSTIPSRTLLTEPSVMALPMTTDAAVSIMGKMRTIPREKNGTTVSQPEPTSPICIGKRLNSMKASAQPRRRKLM